MSNHSRNQGTRTKRTLTARLTEAGIPATKISRSGYAGPDLTIHNLTVEVKAWREAGARHERTLSAVACRPWL
jgi:hypothetical protein